MDPIITNALIGALQDLWAWARADKAWIAGTLGSLGGMLVGQHLSLSRESRTKRNADAQAVRRLILPMMESISPGVHTRLSRLDIDPLRQHLGRCGRRRLDRAYRQYEEACDAGMTQEAIGRPVRTNSQAVHKALKAILGMTRRVWCDRFTHGRPPLRQ